MKAIWTQDTAEYHGEFVNFAPMQTWPKPAQKPYPPLIVGGAFPYGARRAVRNGDGWIPSAGGPGRADIATTLPQFHKLATEAGRDPASLPVTLFRVTEDLDRRHQFRDLGIARGRQPAGHEGGCDPADTRPLGTVDALRHRLTCPPWGHRSARRTLFAQRNARRIPMTSTTCIRDAACIVAWDAANHRHAYLMGGDVVFSGDTLSFVGRHYDGAADTTIDGTNLMVMPGLVNLHSHPSTEPFFRGVREEHGVPSMYMSGLYERSVAMQPDTEARKAGKQVAFCEMLLSGITSVADLSGIDEGWIDLAAQSGLRVFLAPSYASSRWYLENGWALKYRWDEPAGRRGLDAALALIEQAASHPSWPARRHRFAGADRHLHHRPAARQLRRGRGP